MCIVTGSWLPGVEPNFQNVIKQRDFRGAWVAQSVKRPTSAQVTISRSASSSPASVSGLMAQSLEPASDSVSPPLSAPPPFMLCLSVLTFISLACLSVPTLFSQANLLHVSRNDHWPSPMLAPHSVTTNEDQPPPLPLVPVRNSQERPPPSPAQMSRPCLIHIWTQCSHEVGSMTGSPPTTSLCREKRGCYAKEGAAVPKDGVLGTQKLNEPHPISTR